jgi:NAD(P)-dependent dehydrogenase (short-subunit alcohol dehydrogenase family)
LEARSPLSTVQSVTEAAYPTVKALKFAGSITDASAVSHTFATVKEKFGGVDVLVPNAASFPEPKPITASDVDEYSSGLGVNLQGNVIAMQAFLKNRRLREEHEAVLIHVSTAGVQLGAMPVPIRACIVSKIAGVETMKHLPVEMQGKGVRVIRVDPGVP